MIGTNHCIEAPDAVFILATNGAIILTINSCLPVTIRVDNASERRKVMRCEEQLRERDFIGAVQNGARSSVPAPGATDNRKQKSPMVTDMFTNGRVVLARPHNRNTLEANDGGPPRYPAATNVAKHGQVPIQAKNFRSSQLRAPHPQGSPGVEFSSISNTVNKPPSTPQQVPAAWTKGGTGQLTLDRGRDRKPGPRHQGWPTNQRRTP